ncbi:ArsR/SmtB family transcription factor [Sinanaerobacter chloroacetimidivorans]|uniref:Metalloregulator ArsR/SmtB family transcription factor n=1 Tax=Sinanaerobacter chloroacetimidivorans TaxID=2818044 RepID=A0A8J7W3L1_9FIRM|nr:metalloregulator ArsR/SmtB family transcription factor [Sinanaerobacter chloroacetimidivorans]MBR0598533.1 metalloregulator ArsR/SmtB family transcription factor [Sinanaerobacter chloroacetimidivorans]
MNQLINVFKILSDETRLRIVVLLAQQELCVCQLCGILDVSQPKVSKNLSKLRDMNLVIDERKEKFVYYKLKTDNAVLTNTIDNILNDLEKYPQLALDKNRLIDKEKYLNQCCIDQ